jgi:Tfp pilus assembly protein PilO
MNLSNRQHLLAVVAITAVALLAGDKFVFSPLVASWNARSTRLADLRKKVAEGTDKIRREAGVRTQWDSMSNNVLSVEVSAAQNKVLKDFEGWSQDSSLTINSIRPQDKRGSDDEYRTLEFRVDAVGPLMAVTRFLFDVEKDPLALRVESVDINSKDALGQQLQLGLVVSGLILNPPKAANAPKR